MNKKYLFILLLSSISFGQDLFSKGYYVNQNNIKNEGFILDTNPYNNPDQIKFKKSLSDKPIDISLENLKEFKIDNDYKYIRYTVNYDFDRVVNKNNELQIYGKDPSLVNKTVLLKTLVEGNVSLYSAIIQDVVFFYIKDRNDEFPILLVYRKYNLGSSFEENNNFRKQLYDKLKSENLLINDFFKISYNEKELIKIFEKANKQDSSFVDQQINEEKHKNKFYYKVFSGLSSFSFPVQYRTEFNLSPSKKEITLPIIGAEFSQVLGINSKRSELFCRVFYQKGKTDSNYKSIVYSPTLNAGSITEYTFTSEFSIINFSAGYRYAFVNGIKHKFLVDGAIGFSSVLNGDFTLDYTIQYTGNNNQQPSELKLSSALFFNLGIGYVFNNKYGVNIEYSTPKDFLNRYSDLNGSFSNFNLIFTYTLND